MTNNITAKVETLKTMAAVKAALDNTTNAVDAKVAAIKAADDAKDALLSALFSAAYIRQDSEMIAAAIALLGQEKLKDCADAFKWALGFHVDAYITAKFDGSKFTFAVKNWGDYDAVARLLKESPAYTAWKKAKAAEKAAEKKRAEEAARDQLRTGKRCENTAAALAGGIEAACKAQDRMLKAVESEVFSEEQGGDKAKEAVKAAIGFVKSDLIALKAILDFTKKHGITLQEIEARLSELNA